ncbi:hypothetical protein PoB_000636600 [Plakobranchus ocellatus]|uniref:Uncharacterized protein n=1 Tax=Plakobranchus ocellatus TaxID=259542 RepID=A0AAV3Y9F7_9GAST|nr:hypothetical protein PoB_000636600 [Plakobranchus ocellatus]
MGVERMLERGKKTFDADADADLNDDDDDDDDDASDDDNNDDESDDDHEDNKDDEKLNCYCDLFISSAVKLLPIISSIILSLAFRAPSSRVKWIPI